MHFLLVLLLTVGPVWAADSKQIPPAYQCPTPKRKFSLKRMLLAPVHWTLDTVGGIADNVSATAYFLSDQLTGGDH